MPHIFLSLLAIFFYVSALFARWSVTSTRWVVWLGAAGVVTHAVLLQQTVILAEGLNFGIFNAASLVACVMTGLWLMTLSRKPVDSLIVVLFPFAIFSIALDVYFDSRRIVPLNGDIGVKLHIFSSLLAYSLLSIAALQAIFLFVQEYQLRRKRLGWVMQRLPPLQVMETLLFQTLTLGFILLSISLSSGIVFLENLFAQHLVHKTVLSLMAWLIFAVLLWGRFFYGWRGRTAIRWTLSGFVLLVLAYFGSKLVLELILRRV